MNLLIAGLQLNVSDPFQINHCSCLTSEYCPNYQRRNYGDAGLFG